MGLTHELYLPGTPVPGYRLFRPYGIAFGHLSMDLEVEENLELGRTGRALEVE